VPLKLPFPRRTGARPKEERGEEKRGEEWPRPGGPGEELVFGVISGKGGCGKSSISSSLAVLSAALRGPTLAVDLDIVNATTSDLLLSPLDPGLLTADDGVDFLAYVVEGVQEYSFYKIKPQPDRRFSIKVAGKDLGVLVPEGGLYVLPAKKANRRSTHHMELLAKTPREEFAESVFQVVGGIIRRARELGIRNMVFDFPPLQAGRRGFEGVFAALDLVPRVLAVSTFDDASVQGLAQLVYAQGLSPRVWAYLVNMADPEAGDAAKRIEDYLRTRFGSVPVFFIRQDRIWSRATRQGIRMPPITLCDPGQGACRDLLRAAASLGIVSREAIKKYLEVEV